MSAALPATLDDLARDIRDTLDRADKSQRHADDLRITAGQMLLTARRQAEVQGLGWADWLKVNIKRSERDVRRLIAIAKAPDAEAAVAEDRRKAREGMQRTRTNVSPQPAVARVTSPAGPRVEIRVTKVQPVIKTPPPDIPPLKGPRATVYAFSGNLDQLARHIVKDLSPAQAEEFCVAVRKYLDLKRQAIENVGPTVGLH
jgi:hypothetical protein